MRTLQGFTAYLRTDLPAHWSGGRRAGKEQAMTAFNSKMGDMERLALPPPQRIMKTFYIDRNGAQCHTMNNTLGITCLLTMRRGPACSRLPPWCGWPTSEQAAAGWGCIRRVYEGLVNNQLTISVCRALHLELCLAWLGLVPSTLCQFVFKTTPD